MFYIKKQLQSTATFPTTTFIDLKSELRTGFINKQLCILLVVCLFFQIIT